MRVHGYANNDVEAGPGDSISVSLYSNATPWTADVYADFGAGQVYVGQANQGTPSQLTRPGAAWFVATAPGARAWRVTFYGPFGEVAEVQVNASPYPCGRAGITYYQEPAP